MNNQEDNSEAAEKVLIKHGGERVYDLRSLGLHDITNHCLDFFMYYYVTTELSTIMILIRGGMVTYLLGLYLLFTQSNFRNQVQSTCRCKIQ